jgi:Uma2 family endonuclease
MSTAPVTLFRIRTLADLLQRLGGVPLERILFQPYPGTATPRDVLDVQQREGKPCELVAGVVVEKATGLRESALTAHLIDRLKRWVQPGNLGMLSGPNPALELMADLVRTPDIAFTCWDRLPGGRLPESPIPRIVPNLAVEVLCRANSSGERAVKRQDYFAAGVEVLWEIDPDHRTVANLNFGEGASTMLRMGDTLTGGTVLPGFTLPLKELFAELDRRG